MEPALPVKKAVPRQPRKLVLRAWSIGKGAWPSALAGRISLICLRRAVMRLRRLQPGRRAARRRHALERPAYNRTTCPRSGCCKSSVRQKSTVVRTVSVHNPGLTKLSGFQVQIDEANERAARSTSPVAGTSAASWSNAGRRVKGQGGPAHYRLK